MPMPTIDIATSKVSNGPIYEGEQFAWTTSASVSDIQVYAQIMQNGQPWFTPNQNPFNGPATGPLPDNSNVVTAADAVSPASGWTYTCPSIFQGEGHVVVIETIHKRKRKAG